MSENEKVNKWYKGKKWWIMVVAIVAIAVGGYTYKKHLDKLEAERLAEIERQYNLKIDSEVAGIESDLQVSLDLENEEEKIEKLLNLEKELEEYKNGEENDERVVKAYQESIQSLQDYFLNKNRENFSSLKTDAEKSNSKDLKEAEKKLNEFVNDLEKYEAIYENIEEEDFEEFVKSIQEEAGKYKKKYEDLDKKAEEERKKKETEEKARKEEEERKKVEAQTSGSSSSANNSGSSNSGSSNGEGSSSSGGSSSGGSGGGSSSGSSNSGGTNSWGTNEKVDKGTYYWYDKNGNLSNEKAWDRETKQNGDTNYIKDNGNGEKDVFGFEHD